MRERILGIINSTTNPVRRFKELEEWSGVKSDSWRKFHNGRQRATEEMIEGLGKRFPELVLWLVTGVDSKANCQYDIDTYVALKTYRISDILKKEPLDLTDGEMRVVVAEEVRAGAAAATDNRRIEYGDFLMIHEARRLKMSRSQVLDKWQSEQQKKQRNASK